MKHHGNHPKLKAFIGIAVFVFLILVCFNPGRGSFNHSVFDGGTPNPITGDQKIIQEIQKINVQCYQNENDPRVQRKNYVIYSIYDVQASPERTYHVLGILGMFRLLNP